jgi:hypothetical protein
MLRPVLYQVAIKRQFSCGRTQVSALMRAHQPVSAHNSLPLDCGLVLNDAPEAFLPISEKYFLGLIFSCILRRFM